VQRSSFAEKQGCKEDMTAKLEMKDIDMIHYFLGLEVWQRPRDIFHGLGKYAIHILKRFRREDCKPLPMLPPISRGNWRRSCLEARNGEHDLHHDDDDDQNVHRWQPSSTPHFPPNGINQGSSHSSNPEYGRW
jgi:hypothetical protein